jgi:MFS family permease
VGLLTKNFSPVFVCFLVIVSLGDHIFMPLRNSIGITVANHGYEGGVIGFMDATTMVTYIVASLPILFFFNGNRIGDYRILFLLASASALCAGTSFLLMRTHKAADTLSRPRLVFKKKFSLYYAISFISGMRKQIYLVFAPWLLVQTFDQGLKTMTLLNIIGCIIVFFFNPYIGRMIDKHGERKLLVGGGIVCAVLYAAYALLCTRTGDSLIVFVLLAFGLIDKMTQSTLMGRDIFVKHTASSPDEIMPTLSVGVSMDHVASVIAPIFGGLLWTGIGAQWVFAAGAVIAVIYTAMCFLVPGKKQGIQLETPSLPPEDNISIV